MNRPSEEIRKAKVGLRFASAVGKNITRSCNQSLLLKISLVSSECLSSSQTGSTLQTLRCEVCACVCVSGHQSRKEEGKGRVRGGERGGMAVERKKWEMWRKELVLLSSHLLESMVVEDEKRVMKGRGEAVTFLLHAGNVQYVSREQQMLNNLY